MYIVHSTNLTLHYEVLKIIATYSRYVRTTLKGRTQMPAYPKKLERREEGGGTQTKSLHASSAGNYYDAKGFGNRLNMEIDLRCLFGLHVT